MQECYELMRYLFILLTSLVYCYPCNSQPTVTQPKVYTGGGSVILTIVDRDSIVLIADSKQSFDDKRLPEVVNKIKIYQNIFYAQAGTSVLMKNSGKILDLNDTLGSIIKNNKFKNIPAVYKKYLATIIKTYVGKYHVPLHSFTNHDDKDSFVCKISVVKYHNKRPQYIFGSFLLSETRRGFNIRFVEDYVPPGFPFVARSGNLTVIQDFLTNNPAYFNSTGDLLAKCIYLVKLTAAALPGEVGCPIKVVVIKPTGYRWLAPVEDCKF